MDVSISAAPVTANGTVAAHYIVYRDISEQKRAEALSSALYRIGERSNSAVDLQQFFASIHNIVGELMYARNFYVALFDSDSGMLSFPYFVDEEDRAPSPKEAGTRPHGVCAEDGRAAVVHSKGLRRVAGARRCRTGRAAGSGLAGRAAQDTVGNAWRAGGAKLFGQCAVRRP